MIFAFFFDTSHKKKYRRKSKKVFDSIVLTPSTHLEYTPPQKTVWLPVYVDVFKKNYQKASRR